MTTISSSQLTGRFDGRMTAWIFAAVSGTHCSASVELLATVFAFPLFPADCWFPMLESAFSFLHAHLHFATGITFFKNETNFLAERIILYFSTRSTGRSTYKDSCRCWRETWHIKAVKVDAFTRPAPCCRGDSVALHGQMLSRLWCRTRTAQST